jgi:hypothetical protein
VGGSQLEVVLVSERRRLIKRAGLRKRRGLIEGEAMLDSPEKRVGQLRFPSFLCDDFSQLSVERECVKTAMALIKM